MRVVALLSAVFALALGIDPSPAPQATRKTIDVSKLGPQVGELVPDFSLPDQNGKIWTRQSIMGPKGAMLVFVRSADWCPYCKTQLVEIQGRLTELRDQGLGVAAISYDSPATLDAFSHQRGITFPLLADVGSVTITRFGLRNPVPEWASGPDKDDPAVVAEIRKLVSVAGRVSPSWVGIAFPGTFMLDPRGRVASQFFEDFYIDRNTVSSVMLRAGADVPTVSATKVSTGQIDMTTFASDAAIAPGNRLSLAFDVVPHAGIHIYAPGASSYRVFSVKVDPQPFVQVLPVAYPPSETYLFKPLNERVPVYRKPFRLVQDIIVEGTPEAQAALRGKDSLRLTGTVDYQACDDAICFNPASVPVSWTVAVRPIVRERPVQPRP